MMVLSIIGIIIVLVLISLLIAYSNEYSSKVYGYEIFNSGNFIVSVLGYLAIYFGNDWYLEALKTGEDVLNGEVLTLVGIVFLLGVIITNVKRTSLFYGLVMSVVMEILYLAATPIVFFAVLIAMAFLSQTRPVYTINNN